MCLAETDGHPLRAEPPFLDDEAGLDRSALHAYANWNKRSCLVKDRQQLITLVGDADVVVTTDVSLDAQIVDALSHLPENAIHLSITAHGLDGALTTCTGNNLTASARTGWAYINAHLDEPPLQMPERQAGYVGGVVGFIAAAAALRRRNQGTAPERVEISELEAFALTVHPWGIRAVYEDAKQTRGPAGGRVRGAPDPLWRTADGAIHLGFRDWHNWSDAMRELNLPEFADREDLIPDIGRHAMDLDDGSCCCYLVRVCCYRELPRHGV